MAAIGVRNSTTIRGSDTLREGSLPEPNLYVLRPRIFMQATMRAATR